MQIRSARGLFSLQFCISDLTSHSLWLSDSRKNRPRYHPKKCSRLASFTGIPIIWLVAMHFFFTSLLVKEFFMRKLQLLCTFDVIINYGIYFSDVCHNKCDVWRTRESYDIISYKNCIRWVKIREIRVD